MAARLTSYLVVAIVATTLIAGLIVGAQRDDNDGLVDLIVHNAVVYTADGDGTLAEAVAIRGNQILRVGDEGEITRLRRPQTTMIDAGGAAVLPGFNDAHAHVIAGGLAIHQVDLSGASTLEAARRRIRLWAAANADRPWVLGRGWDARLFPGGPARHALDALVPDRPAQLIAADGQSSWVNSSALRLAGVTRRTPDPPGGVIVRDPDTGEATGWLKGSAVSMVAARVPAPTREERGRALRAAVAEAHAYGITSLQHPGAAAEDFELFDEARRAGDLRVRIYAALALDGEFTNADRARILNAGRQYPDDPVFKSGAVKIAVDGSLDPSAMIEASASGVLGEPAIDPDVLNRSVRLVDAEGWQIMAHAAGERAVRMALNAFEHAGRSNRVPARGRRHRVEHADAVDPADTPRFGLLGALASMQPFRGSPPARLDAWPRRLGSERAPARFPYRSIAADGGRLAFGSDWPAAPLNPLLGIQAAVSRTTPAGAPAGGSNPDQRLTLEAAIDAYTIGAAWASFDEGRKGTLAPGMLADLVILSEDIFDLPASELAEVRVAMTIFDGTVVYSRERRTN